MATCWGSSEGRSRVRGGSFELWLSVLVSVVVALMIAYVGDTMSRIGTVADLEEPVEVRVIESDLAEPFVVCTIRPHVTRCRELDLKAGQP